MSTIEVTDLGFEVYVVEGDPNTIQVFDIGLQGAQGAQGASGAQGAQGAQGDPGIVISENEPDNTDILWCDESEAGDMVIPSGGTDGQILAKASNSDYDTEWIDILNTKTTPITLTIDGAGSAITTGIKAYWRCPYACTISSWTLLADISTNVTIDIWKDILANYPPDNSDSITNGHEPTMNATNAEDVDLSDWTTTSIAAGDVLVFNVDSNSAATKLTLVLSVVKT